MASYSSGAHSQSMLAIDFSDFAGGAVTASSATEIDIAGASGTVYKIIGADFTTFDANGFPTDGTVSDFEIGRGVSAPAIFSGLSMSGSAFTGFVESNDLAGFEASALSGNDHIKGYKGNDVLVGEAGNDLFNLVGGGDDTVSGNDGADKFSFGATFTAADTVDGGAGNDRVILDGDYPSLTLGATTLTSVEYLVLTNGHDYDITMNDANVASGAGLAVQAQTLAAGFSLHFDGSAETDGFFHVSGGKGADTLIGGAGDDTLSGGDGDDVIDVSQGGHDIAAGGNGNDTFDAGAVFTKFDRFNGGAGADTLNLNGAYASAITIAASQIDGIENITFGAGNSYTVALSTNTSSNSVNVDASALGAGDSLHFGFGPPGNLAGAVTGGAGDDVIDATNGFITTVDFTHGGEDSVSGLNPNLVTTHINFGSTFDAGDHVSEAPDRNQGEAGPVVNLDGDYSAGVTMTSTTLQDVESFTMTGGHDYNLIFGADGGADELFINDTAQSGDHITLDTNALDPALHLTVTNAAILDITVGGGAFAGGVVIDGQSTGTVEDTSNHTAITVVGPALNAGLALTSHGGEMIADFSAPVVFSDTTMQGFGSMIVEQGVNVTLADGNIAAGHHLSITVVESTVNDSAETDGTIAATVNGGRVTGSQGDDTMQGSAHSDAFTGGLGQDTLRCGTNVDTLVYAGVADSTGTSYDKVSSFDADRDFFQIGHANAPTAFDAAVSGTVNAATFDSDMQTVVGAGQLAAHHAALLTVTGGDQNGETFLVVDENGAAGYQAGQDYLIQLIGLQHAADLSTGNFN
ncbi:MAG TPA: calcium-binding protein [Rhizomicrobium sp.]|jgi:hypothetical protein